MASSFSQSVTSLSSPVGGRLSVPYQRHSRYSRSFESSWIYCFLPIPVSGIDLLFELSEFRIEGNFLNNKLWKIPANIFVFKRYALLLSWSIILSYLLFARFFRYWNNLQDWIGSMNNSLTIESINQVNPFLNLRIFFCTKILKDCTQDFPYKIFLTYGEIFLLPVSFRI